MTLQESTTKTAILEAAITLFNAKGYQGTTIRDIAGKAGVNAANISYYYQGKKGLLEACLVSFFEPYLACLEVEAAKLGPEPAHICLSRAIKSILHFQSNHYLLSRFVWREVTIDSQISREIISLYLMQERFYFKEMIHSALKENRTVIPIGMAVIQLKGMLMMPYLNSQYVREVWAMIPHEPYFAEQYYVTVKNWLDSSIGVRENIFNVSPIAFSI